MANGYSVGNLEFDITALDKSATSFNNVINKLSTMLGLVQDLSSAFRGLGQINTFANGLAKIAKIDLTPVANNIQKIPEAVKPLAGLGEGFKGLGQLTNFANGLHKIAQVSTPDVYKKINSIVRTVAPLQGFGETFKGLGQLTNFANGLQKISKLDMSVVDKQIQSLTVSLRPFLAELNNAAPALTAFSSAMSSLKSQRTIKFSNFSESKGVGVSQNLEKTLRLSSILGKLYFIRNYTKQIGQYVADLVQSGIDYTETLNLWQVAMRGNLDTAEEFITKMNKAYGIAEQTLMKYQATFRNMLSTLGGVSTDVSYQLSEYLTQMALDYASLYNTSIDKAMTVFQSVLSGQVRPIRSISGYDITETTIFQLYQELGGTKTMRQLTQTEKRLLRIYAVFQQMDRSGTIGDLNKTLNNTANQMRIMSESAKELGTWVGKMIEIYVAPALPYLNAFLITAKNIAQAITKALPNYEEFDGTIKGYEEVADAMEEVQGKLLDFDKFRALNSNENSLGIGIDETLISGLAKYESLLANVSNKATQLAEIWTALFVDTETGKVKDNVKSIFASLSGIAGVLLFMQGSNFLTIAQKFNTVLGGINIKAMALNSIMAFGIFYTFAKAIQLWQDGEKAASIFATVIGVTLVGAFIAMQVHQHRATIATTQLANAKAQATVTTAQLYAMQERYNIGIARLLILLAQLNGATEEQVMWAIKDTTAKGQQANATQQLAIAGQSSVVSMNAQNKATKSLAGSMSLLGIACSTVAMGIVSVISSDMSPIEKWVSIFIGLAAAITATAIAFYAFKQDWVKAVATGAMVAGGAMTVVSSLKAYKNGGLVEDGLFTMNKGEVMGTFDDGTSIVANNQQIISGIKQGVYQAVSSALQVNGSNDDRPIEISIDGEKVFQATKKNAKRHGLSFAKA